MIFLFKPGQHRDNVKPLCTAPFWICAKKKMSYFKPAPYFDYLPAKMAEGKESYIYFSVKDPGTGKMRRIKHKINHIKSVRERRSAARQMGLLWGQGPQLYSLDFTGGNITKVWTEDKEIMNWLKSWNFEEYLRACTTDYLHLSGFFNSVHLTKGSRIGAKKIAHLEHIPAKNARLGWTETRTSGT